jgi:hypothetical protein
MKPMVRPTSKRGAREMSVKDQLDAARRELGTAHPELPRGRILAAARIQSGESTDWVSLPLVIALPPERSAATSRDKTG